jgi:hypothetical protein
VPDPLAPERVPAPACVPLPFGAPLVVPAEPPLELPDAAPPEPPLELPDAALVEPLASMCTGGVGMSSLFPHPKDEAAARAARIATRGIDP